MLRQRLLLSGMLATGLALLSSGPAPAQDVGTESDRPSENTAGRAYYEGRGPGYSVEYPSASRADRYRFYPGYYTGDYRPSHFASSNGPYATQSPGYTPIFMTSLNFPGVYGSYVMGLTPASSNVTPNFQTKLDNLPSANPVGAPYAPLDRRLLTTNRSDEAAARIDVALPADATLTVQGETLKDQRGSRREYESPPLRANHSYSYDLKASWSDADGHRVVKTRQVWVRAGDLVRVDFGTAAASETVPAPGTSTLRTRPLSELRRVPGSRDQ